MKRTKIICTVGPASAGEETLKEMVRAGMNVARLNFSHGSYESHHEMMETVRRVRDEMKCPLAIMLDTKGPEIRLKTFQSGSVILKAGNEFLLTGREIEGNEEGCSVSFPGLAKSLKVGDRVLIDDGAIVLKVRSIDETDILCDILTGGKVSNRKGINVPHVRVEMPFLSDADRRDLLFGISEDVDYVAASFVRTREDVEQLRAFLRENGGEKIMIIAKIENEEGVKNMTEIVEAADGVMVARGDMGVEIDFERLPGIQKRIIRECLSHGKISVTATQMLETMIENTTPTRAEISDVANAVFDGTSAIMLSGETAMGKHPALCVRTMAGIAKQAECDAIERGQYPLSFPKKAGRDTAYAISDAAATTADDLNAKAIVVPTLTGHTARNVSRFRPPQCIVAPTPQIKTFRQLSMSWGVRPILCEQTDDLMEMFAQGISAAKTENVVQKGDTVVITAGIPENGQNSNSNIMRIATVD